MKRVLLLFLFLIIIGRSWTNAQCTADFNFMTNNLTVNFQDSSFFTPNIPSISRSWNFGDGNFGSGSNPVHTYANAGTYPACLIIYDSIFSCLDTICKIVTVSSNQSTNCTANFTFSVTPNNVVSFFSNVTGGTAPYTYDWDFGDGPTSHSTMANPTYTYLLPGSYITTLTITDTNGIPCSYIDTVTINSCSAGFSPTVNKDTLRIINLASNYNTVVYDFGDGNRSILGVGDPIHVYSQSGTFTVCQFIADTLNNCSDTLCQVITISSLEPNDECCTQLLDSLINNPCQGNFDYTTNFDTLFIENKSRSLSVSYDFGDGTISTDRNPFHIYSQSGTYRVCQTISQDGCSGVYCDSITIVVPTKCSAAFSYSFSGDTTYFQNRATSAHTFTYRFGDGSTSNDENPTHVYPSSGTYIVEQEIFNDSTFCADLFIDTIQVTVSFSCKAEFIPALDTSQLGVLFLINTSSNDNTHNYLWDFGDGTTSSSRVPTHQFSENRAYKICLTVSDSIQNCTSTFCDSIGLDTNGNILKTNGFTLKIIEGSALSLGENKLDQPLVTVFPNPFRSEITLKSLTPGKLTFYEIYSSQGKLIKGGQLSNSTQHLSFDTIESGLYIIQFRQGSQFSQIKVIKQ